MLLFVVKEGFCLSVCRYRYQEVICDDNVDLMGGENVQWIDGVKLPRFGGQYRTRLQGVDWIFGLS